MSLHDKPVANSIGGSGAALAPAAGATVTTTGVQPAGVYRVRVTAYNAGTQEATAAGTVNMILRHGATTISALPTSATAVTTVFERVTLNGSESLNVSVTATAAAGSVYVASISAVRLGS